MSTKTTTKTRAAKAQAAPPQADAGQAQARAAAKLAAQAQRQAEAAARATRLAPQPCLCGCGVMAGKGSRFLPGHDARMHSTARKIAFGQVEAEPILAGLDERCQAALQDAIAHVDTSSKPKSQERWVVLLLTTQAGEEQLLHTSGKLTTRRQAEDLANAMNSGSGDCWARVEAA